MPLAVPLIGAMAVGAVMPWKRARLFPALQRLWWAALGGLAAFLVCLALTGVRIGPALGFAAGVWLVLGAAADIADRLALFSRPRAALARALALPRSAWGGAVAHAGMGVLLLGLAGMGLATDKLALLQQHPRVSWFNKERLAFRNQYTLAAIRRQCLYPARNPRFSSIELRCCCLENNVLPSLARCSVIHLQARSNGNLIWQTWETTPRQSFIH